MIGKKHLKIFGRRRFLEVAAGALATTQLVPSQTANAGLVVDRPIKLAEAETPGSLSPLKQIDAGVLNVGYVEAGPIDGPAAILLHGWPYDIHSFDEVTPRLASAGFRVIVPYARGYGSTSFLSNETPQDGSAVCLGGRHDRLDGRTQHQAGDHRRLRLGRAHRRYRRRTLAGSRQGHRFGERLPHWKPGGGEDASSSEGRASVVVPILFRDGAWSRGVLQIPAGVRRVDLEARVTKMGIRRRDIRSQRGSLR